MKRLVIATPPEGDLLLSDEERACIDDQWRAAQRERDPLIIFPPGWRVALIGRWLSLPLLIGGPVPLKLYQRAMLALLTAATVGASIAFACLLYGVARG